MGLSLGCVPRSAARWALGGDARRRASRGDDNLAGRAGHVGSTGCRAAASGSLRLANEDGRADAGERGSIPAAGCVPQRRAGGRGPGQQPGRCRRLRPGAPAVVGEGGAAGRIVPGPRSLPRRSIRFVPRRWS